MKLEDIYQDKNKLDQKIKEFLPLCNNHTIALALARHRLYFDAKKYFVFDTSALMEKPVLFEKIITRRISRGEPIECVIPDVVFRELDGLKKSTESDIRRKANNATGLISNFQQYIKIMPTSRNHDIRYLASDEDNSIIALLMDGKLNDGLVYLVTCDKNLRIVAENCGIGTVSSLYSDIPDNLDIHTAFVPERNGYNTTMEVAIIKAALGVYGEPDRDELKNKYHELIKKYHPDTNSGGGQNETAHLKTIFLNKIKANFDILLGYRPSRNQSQQNTQTHASREAEQKWQEYTQWYQEELKRFWEKYGKEKTYREAYKKAYKRTAHKEEKVGKEGTILVIWILINLLLLLYMAITGDNIFDKVAGIFRDLVNELKVSYNEISEVLKMAKGDPLKILMILKTATVKKLSVITLVILLLSISYILSRKRWFVIVSRILGFGLLIIGIPVLVHTHMFNAKIYVGIVSAFVILNIMPYIRNRRRA